jgi:tetratricopeptide (TPR) repeat protein
LAKGEVAALKAVELDETLAEGHTALGVIKLYSWQWSAAEREFKRALELNPNYAPAHSWYAIYFGARGRVGESIARMYRARDIDPLSPHITQNIGWMLHYAGQYDEEIEQYRRALELDPNFQFARHRLAKAYFAKGMFDEAIAEHERVIALSNRNPSELAMLGRAYGLLGRKNEARQILRELLEMNERGYVNSYSIALVYFGLGEKDQAFKWLEKAYQERSYAMVFLKVSMDFGPYRQDSRYIDLLRRIGLEQ